MQIESGDTPPQGARPHLPATIVCWAVIDQQHFHHIRRHAMTTSLAPFLSLAFRSLVWGQLLSLFAIATYALPGFIKEAKADCATCEIPNQNSCVLTCTQGTSSCSVGGLIFPVASWEWQWQNYSTCVGPTNDLCYNNVQWQCATAYYYSDRGCSNQVCSLAVMIQGCSGDVQNGCEAG